MIKNVKCSGCCSYMNTNIYGDIQICISVSVSISTKISTCNALHDLVPFVQFKKREKHPTLLKVTLLHGCFSRFLNYTNGTKSLKAPHIIGV